MAIDFGDITQAAYLALLKRLQGSGYTSEDGTKRVTELDGIAAVAAKVAEKLTLAGRSMFASEAIGTALDLWDLTFTLSNNVARTDADRQKRLRYFLSSFGRQPYLSASFGGVRERVSWFRRITQFDPATAASIADTTASALVSAGDEHIGLSRFVISTSATSKEVIKRYRDFIDRAIPARYAGDIKSGPDANLNSLSCLLDLSTPAADSATAKKHPVRLVNYINKRTPIYGKDLNDIQANVCWGLAGLKAITGSGVCGREIVVWGDIAPSATIDLDTSVNWDGRLIEVYGFVDTASDFRPTFAAEDLTASAYGTYGVATLVSTHLTHYDRTTQFCELRRPGAGTTSNLSLNVKAADGTTLQLKNHTAATRYYVLWIRASARIDSSADDTANPRPWRTRFPEDSASGYSTFNQVGLNAAFMQDLWKAAAIGKSTAQASETPDGASFREGGTRRVVVMTDAIKPTSLGKSWVLDSSQDWRKRYVLVESLIDRDTGANPESISKHPAKTNYARSDTGGFTSRSVAPVVFYTGTGATKDTATKQAFQQGIKLNSHSTPNEYYIYADSTTGYLMGETKSGVASTAFLTSVAMVLSATEQIDSSANSPPILSFADTTDLTSFELNTIQDCGLLAQAQPGRRKTLAEAAPTPIDAHPLGPISWSGPPYIPREFYVRERLGGLDDGKIQVRQPVFGGRRFAFAARANDPEEVLIAHATLTTDDLLDLKDRLVSMIWRYDITDDIRPNKAQASAFESNSSGYAGFYAGQALYISTITIPITGNANFKLYYHRDYYARGHGRAVLSLVNSGAGGAISVVGMLSSSFPLGFLDPNNY